jgi:hypothetical protein
MVISALGVFKVWIWMGVGIGKLLFVFVLKTFSQQNVMLWVLAGIWLTACYIAFR